MRKYDGAFPNDQLRRERLRRGWSREYVAEHIGVADPKTIGRWERGAAFPSAHFRQRLCNLFELLPQDLGLFHEESKNGAQGLPRRLGMQHEPAPAVVSLFPLYDPLIPPPLTETGGLVGRENELERLKLRLCASRRLAGALYGLPGVGKTVLAAELVHDDAIQSHFPDGALWVSLGPHPDVAALLRRWSALLGLREIEEVQGGCAEDLARAIHAAIGTRRILFVIDDAWTYEAALTFKLGGPNCSYLLTTRIPFVALQFANDGAVHLNEFGEEDGLELLAHFIPEIVTTQPATMGTLVQAVGGLPLGLTLMGKYLQARAYHGHPRRIQEALALLRHAPERLRLTMPRTLLERLTGLPEQCALSLEAVIGTSAAQLDDEARRVLWQLAAFPAKPYSFSEEAALAVSNAPAEALDALVDIGLLESAGRGCYTLHQTIADYASVACGTEVHKRMIDDFPGPVEAPAADYHDLTVV